MTTAKNETETETVDTVAVLEQIKDMIVPIILPLNSGTVLEMSEEEQKELSTFVRALHEMVSSIREGHDTWVRYEWENAKDKTFHVDTIRGTMVKAGKAQGFLKL